MSWLFSLDAVVYFWRLHPALYYALWALIGVYASLTPHIALAIPACLLLIFPLLSPRATASCKGRLVLGCLSGLLFFAYAKVLYHFPVLPEEGVKGVVHFTPTNLHLLPSRLGLSWRIEGALHAFLPFLSQDQGQRGQAQNFSIKRARLILDLPHAHKNHVPIESRPYCMRGQLNGTGTAGSYFFKAAKNQLTSPVTSMVTPPDLTSSLTHSRYFSKQWVEQTIYAAFPDEQIAALLSGLVTGEVSDRGLSTTLMRFGLLHIMAVSGLHFSLLIAFLSPLFRCLFPLMWSKWLLLCALSGYVLFLGPNPSVLRAFAGIAIATIGSMLCKAASSCNILGLSLLLFLLYEPSTALLLSFQLSFLATASILLLYAPFSALMGLILRRLPLSQLLKAHKWDQCAAIVMAGLRSSCALTLAVHAAMVPVSLYFFGFFPYLSLFYNLFFPSLIGISLLLLLLGLTLQLCIAPCGEFVHTVNSIYTRLVLNTALQMPPFWDRIAIRASPSGTLTLIFLSLLLFAAIAVRRKLEEQE